MIIILRIVVWLLGAPILMKRKRPVNDKMAAILFSVSLLLKPHNGSNEWLKCGDHRDYIYNSVYNLSLIFKARHLFDQCTSLLSYQTLLVPVIDYCEEVTKNAEYCMSCDSYIPPYCMHSTLNVDTLIWIRRNGCTHDAKTNAQTWYHKQNNSDDSNI